MTDSTGLRKPRPPGPASEPAGGTVRRVRAALGVLFPEAPEPRPGPGDAARPAGRRAVYVAIEVAAVCTGAAVLLPRIAGVPSWDSVYAEDQGVFLFDALARPWHLLVPFGGYEQFMPRLVGQLVSYLPLADAAVPYALAGAGIAALCALFIYHAMDGWIRSPWLRALTGAALILLPLAPIEIADSAVGAPWYVLTALFFALLWRPKNWAGMTAAALVAFAAASSEILAVVYAPLVLLRLVALPRWREHAVTAGWLAGLLVQLPVVLESYARHTQRLRSLARPVQSLGFYFHHVALRALGWRVSVRLVQIAGLNGATVIVCAILVAGLCWALVTGSLREPGIHRRRADHGVRAVGRRRHRGPGGDPPAVPGLLRGRLPVRSHADYGDDGRRRGRGRCPPAPGQRRRRRQECAHPPIAPGTRRRRCPGLRAGAQLGPRLPVRHPAHVLGSLAARGGADADRLRAQHQRHDHYLDVGEQHDHHPVLPAAQIARCTSQSGSGLTTT